MRCYPHFILPMRRSRGFASTATNSFALFRLAFASAPPQNGLTWLMTVSRRIIMQKARRHPGLRHWAPTACRIVNLKPHAYKRSEPSGASPGDGVPFA